MIDQCPRGVPSDIGYDILPRLVGKAHSLVIDGYFQDIGTVDAYRNAGEDWAARSTR